jgi:hypothetical protein
MKRKASLQRTPCLCLLILALGPGCNARDLAFANGDAGSGDAIAEAANGDGSGEDRSSDSSGTITFQVDGKTLVLPAQSMCTGGHQNFDATDGTNAFFLSIFIQRVGNYSCTDPLPYIFLQYQGPAQGDASTFTGPDGASANIFLPPGTGPQYAFNAAGGGGGQCTIAVNERRPRFKATFAATLDLAAGQGPPMVTIESGQIDVGTPAMGCL